MKKRLEKLVYDNTRIKPNKYVKLKFIPFVDKYYIEQKLSYKGWLLVLLALPIFIIGACLVLPAKLLLKINELTCNKVFSLLNQSDVLSIFINGNKGRYFFSNEELTNSIKDVLNESNKETSDS